MDAQEPTFAQPAGDRGVVDAAREQLIAGGPRTLAIGDRLDAGIDAGTRSDSYPALAQQFNRACRITPVFRQLSGTRPAAGVGVPLSAR
jgi:hypothetical protein